MVIDKPMRRFVEAASRKNAVDREEVDRIPGTTKLRTWCASNPSLYSDKGTIENIVRGVQICSRFL